MRPGFGEDAPAGFKGFELACDQKKVPVGGYLAVGFYARVVVVAGDPDAALAADGGRGGIPFGHGVGVALERLVRELVGAEPATGAVLENQLREAGVAVFF